MSFVAYDLSPFLKSWRTARKERSKDLGPTSGTVDNDEDFYSCLRNTVRNYEWRVGDNQFPSAFHPSLPPDQGVSLQSIKGRLDSGDD